MGDTLTLEDLINAKALLVENGRIERECVDGKGHKLASFLDVCLRQGDFVGFYSICVDCQYSPTGCFSIKSI